VRGLWIFSGKTTISEAAGIIAAASLMVQRLGLMHMAAAVGAPLVALFGSTDPTDTGPLSKKSVVLRGEAGCAPCFKRRCPRRLECFDGLTVGRVEEASERALAMGPERHEGTRVKLSAMGTSSTPCRRFAADRRGARDCLGGDARYGAGPRSFPPASRGRTCLTSRGGGGPLEGAVSGKVCGCSDSLVGIRSVGYDLALDLQGLLKSALLSRMAGARKVAGFAASACRERASALFYGQRIAVDTSAPVSEQILRVAASAAGVPRQRPIPSWRLPPDAQEKADELLRETAAADPHILVVGAGWPTKVLPAGTFRSWRSRSPRGGP